MKQFKASLLTFDTVSDAIQTKIDSRTLGFKKEFKVEFESYTTPLLISVLNEYVEDVNAFFKLNGSEITLQPEPFFRVSDYTYTQKDNYYNVDCECDDIIFHIDRYSTRYNLDLNPAFQRGYVWSQEQKQRFIEYLVSGGMSGRDIFINATNWDNKKDVNMVLVDGKQRLSAIMDFINGVFPIYNNVFVSDLRYRDRANIRIKININNIEDYADIVRWYISMNTGGSIHTEDDLKVAYAELDKNK